MTGNGDSKIVRRARASDGAHSLRRSDAPGDLGVGDSVSEGDFLERLPHAPLERRAADVEREIEADAGPLNKTDNPRDQGLVIAIGADKTRFRKTILKIADEFFGIVTEQDRGNTLLAGRDEDDAKRRLPDGELDFLVGAAGAVL